MMTIAGQPFLTDFQTQQLISQFQQKTELNVSQISTQQVYVLSHKLSADEQKRHWTYLASKRALSLPLHKTTKYKLS